MFDTLFTGMKKRLAILGVILGLVWASTMARADDTGYALAGDAAYVSPGNSSSRAVQLVSDPDPGYSALVFTIPSGLTLSQINTLSTDVWVEGDDACSDGSPRFQITVLDDSETKQVNAYVGNEPLNQCPSETWVNFGNEMMPGQNLDTSALVNGLLFDPYQGAIDKYGSLPVTEIRLVVDAGQFYPDGEQAIRVDNTNINGTVYDFNSQFPTDKDQCKKGGWKNLQDDTGKPFKNQGDCVSFVNHLN